MPTGYTAPVQDGSITTLEEFTLLCARAFGVAISMREEPLDKPIPEEFEPDTSYHHKQLDILTRRLIELKEMTRQEAVKASTEEYNLAATEREKHIKEDKEKLSRYIDMLDRVQKWNPPKEYSQIKKFMIEQLESSIEFDSFTRPEVECRTGSQWKDFHIEATESSIQYHRTCIEEEIKRTNDRNKWLKGLRESLKSAV